jgi:predicted phage tail component-like protein
MRHFFLNGIDSRDHGFAMSIERSVLPTLEPVTVTIPRRAGAYVPKKRSREVGMLAFKVRFAILGFNYPDFRARVRAVASWLFNANKAGSAAPLYFSDDPNRIYYVWIEGSTDIEQIVYEGEFEFTMIAPEPFAYLNYESSVVFDTPKATNLIANDHHSFEGFALAAFRASTIAVIDTVHARSGTKALNINIQSTTDNQVWLGASNVDYNQPVTAGSSYIFSWYSYGEVPTSVQGAIKFNNATPTVVTSSVQSVPAGVWTKHFVQATAPTGATSCILRLDCEVAWTEVWFDDLQFELASTGQTLPSEYKAPTAIAIKKQIRNDGTIEAYPRFKITPTTDLTYIKISDGKGNTILLNNRTFTAWTIIIVDNLKGDIYFEATGASLMNWLTMDSRFFKLDPTTDYNLTIEVNAGGNLSASVNWQQKYL